MTADTVMEDVPMTDPSLVDTSLVVNTSLAASIRAATSSETNAKKPAKLPKARELFHCTISKPMFAYAQVEVVTAGTARVSFDDVQIRSFCDAALAQFLGATGAAMPLDLLKSDGRAFWMRVPREDLGLFTAALAAWTGVSDDEGGSFCGLLQLETGWEV